MPRFTYFLNSFLPFAPAPTSLGRAQVPSLDPCLGVAVGRGPGRGEGDALGMGLLEGRGEEQDTAFREVAEPREGSSDCDQEKPLCSGRWRGGAEHLGWGGQTPQVLTRAFASLGAEWVRVCETRSPSLGGAGQGTVQKPPGTPSEYRAASAPEVPAGRGLPPGPRFSSEHKTVLSSPWRGMAGTYIRRQVVESHGGTWSGVRAVTLYMVAWGDHSEDI